MLQVNSSNPYVFDGSDPDTGLRYTITTADDQRYILTGWVEGKACQYQVMGYWRLMRIRPPDNPPMGDLSEENLEQKCLTCCQ